MSDASERLVECILDLESKLTAAKTEVIQLSIEQGQLLAELANARAELDRALEAYELVLLDRDELKKEKQELADRVAELEDALHISELDHDATVRYYEEFRLEEAA